MLPCKPINRKSTVMVLLIALSLGISLVTHAQTTYKFRPATTATATADTPVDEPLADNSISVIKFKVTQQNGRPFTDIVSVVLYNNKKRVIYYKEGDVGGFIEFKIKEHYTDQILNFYLLDKYGNEQYIHLHLDDFSETPEATLYKADAKTLGLLIKVQLQQPEDRSLKYMHGAGKKESWKNRRTIPTLKKEEIILDN